MIEVHPNLFVGNQLDYENLVKDRNTGKPKDDWAVVHACKEPYHRAALGGYTGRSVGKEHPEYLFAIREREISLNMVDVPNPDFVAPAMVDAALEFIGDYIGFRTVLVHCNQGGSRGPTIAMLYMAKSLPADFGLAEAMFTGLYPAYAPAGGCRGYAERHWAKYGS